MGTNPHQTARRLDKALALADAWIELAKTSKDEDTTVEIINQAIELASIHGAWRSAIALAGVNTPSPETQDLTVAILRRRLADHGKDPFRGF